MLVFELISLNLRAWISQNNTTTHAYGDLFEAAASQVQIKRDFNQT